MNTNTHVNAMLQIVKQIDFFFPSDFLRDKLKYGDGLTKFTKQSHNLRQYLVIEPLLRHKSQKNQNCMVSRNPLSLLYL